ncbi:DUF2795 domain-containing protein [Nocardiopsis lambiniae]|uniref:DUF2795 domain-containing protein n=1 Tax=Nocardiopsis lambiniae TaxID=3075539 RepID=A0ABU2M2Z3_9ACTN|nr:DUF2795 domain-containing protein [Nocardiopsis sp. DSM 44743]MDT0327014.1 DUF2795 domain-containing protein [Nocardiopsis sp. DSM 44743]
MVTRTDIADSLEGAFGSGPLTRRQIISAADLRGASGELLAALGRLPEGTYSHLRDLWKHLGDVPRGV